MAWHSKELNSDSPLRYPLILPTLSICQLNTRNLNILISSVLLLIGIILFQQFRQETPDGEGTPILAQPVADVVVDGEKIFSILAKDALRSIDRPKFVKAADAEISPVIGISDGKIARAYSINLLDRHEIVNDRIGAYPIAITW